MSRAALGILTEMEKFGPVASPMSGPLTPFQRISTLPSVNELPVTVTLLPTGP